MLRLVVLCLAVAGCFAAPQLTDCHPNGDSAVILSNPKVTPYPPRLPGKVKITVDVEIKRPVDKFDLNVTLTKDLDGFPLKIPCLDGIGSCYYDNACAALDRLFPDGKCPEGLTQCKCPFKPNKLQIKDLELDLPQLPPEIAPIVDGKYEITLSLHDSANRNVLSCLNVKLQIAAA